jgi:serine/threonine protein kinase
MLGATVYMMMTGIPPPRTSHYDWQISRMNDKGFSQGIREVVSQMLQPHPNDRPTALELVNIIEHLWGGWRATTDEGAQYVDINDELVERAARGVGGELDF